MWPVSELLPHAGNTILIDTVVACGDDTLTALATVRPGGLYNLPDGSLPPWLGLEIMAQAVAAWAGCQARRAGMPVELGFLLGTRRYDCRVDAFAAGNTLIIDVARTLQDAGGMAVFECTLRAGDVLLAQARLNVYRPPDVHAFMQEAPPSQEEYNAS